MVQGNDSLSSLIEDLALEHAMADPSVKDEVIGVQEKLQLVIDQAEAESRSDIVDLFLPGKTAIDEAVSDPSDNLEEAASDALDTLAELIDEGRDLAQNPPPETDEADQEETTPEISPELLSNLQEIDVTSPLLNTNEPDNLDQLRETLSDLHQQAQDQNADEIAELLANQIEVLDSAMEQSPQKAGDMLKGIGEALSTVQEEDSDSCAWEIPDEAELSLPDNADRVMLADFLNRYSKEIDSLNKLAWTIDDTGTLSDEQRATIDTFFHNLKGDAGIFGFSAIQDFCDRYKEAVASDTPAQWFADFLPEATRWINNAFESFLHNTRPKRSIDDVFQSIETASDKSTNDLDLAASTDSQMLNEFVENRRPNLLDIQELSIDIEDGDGDEEELKRLLHTIKGEAGMLGLDQLEALCHQLETLIQSDTPATEDADYVLRAKDWLEEAFDAYAQETTPRESAQPLIEEIQNCHGMDDLASDCADSDDGSSDTSDGTASDDGSMSDESDQEASAGDEAEDHEEDVVLEERETPGVLMEDPDMVIEFVEESLEHLQTADARLLELEDDPHNADAVNAVFRAFHTIKGLAGFFELEHVQRLSHRAENMLDEARDDNLTLQGAVADCAFDSVDMLKELITDVRETLESGTPLPHRDGASDLLGDINTILNGDVPVREETPTEEPSQKLDPHEKLGEILVEQGAVTQEELDDALQEQAEEESEHPPIGELLVKAAKTTSKKVREAIAEQLEGGRHELIGELLVQKGEVTRQDVREALREQEKPPKKEPIGEKLVEKGSAKGKDVAKAIRQQDQARSKDKKSKKKKKGSKSDGQKSQKSKTSSNNGTTVRESIRVDADRLDHLIETIGEMVIAQSMVQQSMEDVDIGHATGIQRKLDRLDKMTRELQEVGMSLRMVPINATFKKMARLVRDLSRKSGKEVDFEMSGENTELDKSLVDQIGDPLVHLIRNAVDHGIETPEERRASGKPPTGHVYLRAFHEGGNIYIQVEDDGKGLDRDAILNKAREKGIIEDGEELTDTEVYNLIFRPGFSTNTEVTDVSGRGVGMDVVKRNIESMRGQVEVDSEPGEGSTFSIRLPLTLAIIDGMVIGVGDERYVIPTLSIEQSVRPGENDITHVLGKGQMLDFQNKDIPMYHLGRLFKIDDAEDEYQEGLVVVVDCDDRQIGLFVDELLGQQQTVIKSLGGGLQKQPGLSGGAIMPDGKVALILDVPGLVKMAQKTMDGHAQTQQTMKV